MKNTKPTIENFAVVILPAIIVVFVIFFLVMPKVRENRSEPERPERSSMSPEECIALGGEPLNIVGGATCAEGEENLGEVVGFISPNICCAPIK
ncbi:hypothetical protein JXD20_03710 [Candidatus Peregrinibacteria bacterium]|nr:hypothetical protein [Candidatus Peregrinibacteria bacterium]